MSAAAVDPYPVVPATAEDLGHPLRYVLLVAGEWRSNCNCHRWWLLDPDEAWAAWSRQGLR